MENKKRREIKGKKEKMYVCRWEWKWVDENIKQSKKCVGEEKR